jgi:hypothetical protein
MKTRSFEFENGELVREKITGFEGTITGTVFYITGCNQYLVSAASKNSTSTPKAIWYDEGRLERVKTSGDPIVVENKVGDYDKDNGPDIVAPGGKRGY